MNKLISMLLCFSLVTVLFVGCSTATKAEPNYEKIYGKVTKNSESVFKYANLGYPKEYFKYRKIKFNKHFLYDLDKNGIKELFVYDSKLGLVNVFTIKKNKLIDLGYDFFYGINKKKKVLITKGHWHGAGGSGNKEWWVCKLNKKKTALENVWYIDKMPKYYTIYKGKEFKEVTKKQKKVYKKVYKKYVKGTSRVFK